MFLALLELSIVFLGLFFVFTQLITPIMKNKPILPAFRKTGEIKEKIVIKESELQDEKLLDHLHKLDTKITEKKKRRKK